jgi:cation transport ATPase
MKTSVIEVRAMLAVLNLDEVEKRLCDVPGVERATVNFAAGNATVRYDETRLEVADIKAIVHQRGHQPAAESVPEQDSEDETASKVAVAPRHESEESQKSQKAAPTAATDHARAGHEGQPAASAQTPEPAAPTEAPAHQGHQHHHAHMAADFRQRFWISLVLTLPILALSPLLQPLLGLRETVGFSGDLYVLFGFSSAVFWYGGWPFLKGMITQLKAFKPAMITLVAVAISTAYLYSSAVVFGLTGKVFFWELATLVDIMLLGHWIEMKSVMGASRALEQLAKLMPSDAHKLMPGGSVKDVPLSELAVDDQVLIKPGEKVPADGDIVEGASSVNAAMLTGESTPVSKSSGGKAIAASSDAKLAADNFKSIRGKGAEGKVDGREIKVVSPSYLREQNIELADERIEPLQAQGTTVVFVLVDGQLQGAIALAGIIRPEAKPAIGAGSDVAVETADIVLVRSNPLDVVAIVELSRATYRKMIQNLVWATGYNVVALPLAAGALFAWGVLLSPALAAALMAASTVIVAINARLLRLKKTPGSEARDQDDSAKPKQPASPSKRRSPVASAGAST